MGRQRFGQRQHLYLFLAGLIVISWCGCAHDRPAAPEQAPHEREEACSGHQPDARWRHLQPVEAQIGEGDFDGAIREYERMQALPEPERQDDLVLFDLGLLLSHYANPRRDYGRSLLYFRRLVREYPSSPLAEEAKIWIELLETLERTKRVDIELEERKKALAN